MEVSRRHCAGKAGEGTGRRLRSLLRGHGLAGGLGDLDGLQKAGLREGRRFIENGSPL